MSNDYEIIKHDQINDLIAQELASIVKENYGVDIYQMSQKELYKFLKSALRRKQTVHSRALWWALQQGTRIVMPILYMKFVPFICSLNYKF